MYVLSRHRHANVKRMTVSAPITAPPAWTPPVRKPPLDARQKSGARLAGIVGFLLLNVGSLLFGLPLVLLAATALFALFIGVIARMSNGSEQEWLAFVGDIDVVSFIPQLLLSSLLGAVVMVASLFVSTAILRRHGVNRPWAVTWASVGIATVASWILSGIATIPLQFATQMADGSGNAWADSIAAWIVGSVLVVAAIVAVGLLSWWWMAHVLRSPQQ